MALLVYQDDEGQQQVVRHVATASVLRDIAIRRAVEVKAETLFDESRQQYARQLQAEQVVKGYNIAMRNARTSELQIAPSAVDITETQRTSFQTWVKAQRKWRKKSPITPQLLMASAYSQGYRVNADGLAGENALRALPEAQS